MREGRTEECEESEREGRRCGNERREERGDEGEGTQCTTTQTWCTEPSGPAKEMIIMQVGLDTVGHLSVVQATQTWCTKPSTRPITVNTPPTTAPAHERSQQRVSPPDTATHTRKTAVHTHPRGKTTALLPSLSFASPLFSLALFTLGEEMQT